MVLDRKIGSERLPKMDLAKSFALTVTRRWLWSERSPWIVSARRVGLEGRQEMALASEICQGRHQEVVSARKIAWKEEVCPGEKDQTALSYSDYCLQPRFGG